jgi:hypothetical protein
MKETLRDVSFLIKNEKLPRRAHSSISLCEKIHNNEDLRTQE